MILVSDDSRIMNLPPYVDHVAKIRSKLPITVLEKKTEQNYRTKLQENDFKKNHKVSIKTFKTPSGGNGQVIGKQVD